MIKQVFLSMTFALVSINSYAALCTQPKSFPANQDEILSFSKETATALFTFKFDDMNTHLRELKPCFSEQGWQSYQNALSASHTLENINKLKLIATATLDSQTIERDPNNLWQVTNVLTVEYKNNTHQASQKLKVMALIADADQELSLLQIKATELSLNDKSDSTTTAQPESNTQQG